MRSDRTIIRKYVPLAVLAALALIYISPVLADIRNIGVADWDSQFFYHAAPLKTILEYGQFPLWNPYFCGGAPMLASPELSFLSPAYVLVLLFGEVVGVKLVIVLFTVLGMWGMYMLSRTLGLGRVSSLFPPVAYIMSSWYALRITEGHSGFLPFALLPYVVAFYVKSVEERSIKSFILSGLFWAWPRKSSSATLPRQAFPIASTVPTSSGFTCATGSGSICFPICERISTPISTTPGGKPP